MLLCLLALNSWRKHFLPHQARAQPLFCHDLFSVFLDLSPPDFVSLVTLNQTQTLNVYQTLILLETLQWWFVV